MDSQVVTNIPKQFQCGYSVDCFCMEIISQKDQSSRQRAPCTRKDHSSSRAHQNSSQAFPVQPKRPNPRTCRAPPKSREPKHAGLVLFARENHIIKLKKQQRQTISGKGEKVIQQRTSGTRAERAEATFSDKDHCPGAEKAVLCFG